MVDNGKIKFSIITVVKNGLPYLEAALESYRRQTYKNKELIVVYSDSKDSTENFLLKKKQFIDVLRHDSKSTNKFGSINLGISFCTGNYIGLLHSDDIFYSNKTLEDIAKFIKTKYSDLIYGNVMFCDRNNLKRINRVWIEKKFNIRSLDKGWMPPHTSIFIKNSIVKKVGKYSEDYTISADYDYIVRLFKYKNLKIDHYNNFVSLMRSGGDSSHIKNLLQKLVEDYKIARIFFKSAWLTIFFKIFSKTKQIFIKKKLKDSDYINILNSNLNIKIVQNTEKINFDKNFVLVGLNLAYIGYVESKKIWINKNFIHWPDGVFCKRINKNLKKIPGRNILKDLVIPGNISQVNVIGDLSENGRKYLISKFKNKKIINTIMPYKSAEKLFKYVPLINKNEICILTLPTPKQEIVANYIANQHESYKLICIGGGLSMLSGDEKPVPRILEKLGMEAFWRLRFDTKRRTVRLIGSFFGYLKLEMKGYFSSLKIYNL